MNNKRTIIIAVSVIIVLVLGGLFAFSRFAGSNTEEEITPTPSPTPAYQEVDESVDATLEPNAARTIVTLTVSGMDGRYESIEYELTYMTDSGPKGTLSGARPIELDDPDEFSREVELGTCSTGGKCTYHEGVKDFNVFVKFYTPDGEIFVLRKEFEEI